MPGADPQIWIRVSGKDMSDRLRRTITAGTVAETRQWVQAGVQVNIKKLQKYIYVCIFNYKLDKVTKKIYNLHRTICIFLVIFREILCGRTSASA